MSFNINDVVVRREGTEEMQLLRLEERLTLPQARALTAALATSTFVEELDLNLGRCTVPAIAPFVDYIGSSPQRLKEVSVWCCTANQFNEPEEVQQGDTATMACDFSGGARQPIHPNVHGNFTVATLFIVGLYKRLCNDDIQSPCQYAIAGRIRYYVS
jgi:hypothetical protein